MFNKDMANWFDGFENDQPVSDGAWANAWAPVFDKSQAAKPASVTAHDAASAHVMLVRDVRPTQGMGGAPNHG